MPQHRQNQWLKEVTDLLRPIANWEALNGTAAAPVTEKERSELLLIITSWASRHSARSLLQSIGQDIQVSGEHHGQHQS